MTFPTFFLAFLAALPHGDYFHNYKIWHKLHQCDSYQRLRPKLKIKNNNNKRKDFGTCDKFTVKISLLIFAVGVLLMWKSASRKRRVNSQQCGCSHRDKIRNNKHWFIPVSPWCPNMAQPRGALIKYWFVKKKTITRVTTVRFDDSFIKDYELKTFKAYCDLL